MSVPLLRAGILAVMLQQVVAVSMIGRALVLFFNLIPWARGGKERKYHCESLFWLCYLLTPELVAEPNRQPNANKAHTYLHRYVQKVLRRGTKYGKPFSGGTRKEEQLSYASGTNQEPSPGRRS